MSLTNVFWLAQFSGCEFILGYDDADYEEPSARKRKKPCRFRWPDEILACLLKLNAECAPRDLEKRANAFAAGC